MKKLVERKILLNPGPATTSDSVKWAQIVSDICPREQEFIDVLNNVRRGLLKIVNASENYTCIMLTGSGTAAMDSTINSVIPAGRKILIINNGAYGERFVRIAKTYNIECYELKCSWTESPDINKIKTILKGDNDISHLAIVHHETTTGLLNPIRKIGEIAHSLNRCLIVDTISSFAGVDIDIQRDHIDYLMSSSNKCIQGMAGLSFVICKKSEIEKTTNIPSRSYYLNLYNQYKYFEEKGEMQFTPPVQVVYALQQAINEYNSETGFARFNRYSKNWITLVTGLKKIGLKLLLEEKLQSHLLTTIIEPSNVNYDFKMMHDLLYEKGFTIYPGKIGFLNTFRIANIGDIDSRDINLFISELQNVFRKMKIEGELYV